MPPPPRFEWTQVPASHRHVSKVMEECNWLQALEGGIDTSHAPILHRALTPTPRGRASTRAARSSAARPPTLEVDVTDYGYRYAGVRKLPEGGKLRARLPLRDAVHPAPAASLFGPRLAAATARLGPGHFWVPMDDQTCMVWNFMYRFGDEPAHRGGPAASTATATGPTTSTRRRFRALRNARNNWVIDRQVQKTETFTGIEGVNTQDRAVQESMGPIVDRSRGVSGPADKAIIAMRRLLLQAVKTVQAGGDPPGGRRQLLPACAPSSGSSRTSVEWRDEMLPLMYPASAPARELVGSVLSRVAPERRPLRVFVSRQISDDGAPTYRPASGRRRLAGRNAATPR